MNHRAVLPLVLAQFLSSLADNALLMVAIGLLLQRHAPQWMTPALRFVFYFAYVLLGAFAGAVADAAPKGRVMLASNLVKVGGCVLLSLGTPPLVAYALVGLGAAAYGPAKYGILPELLPADHLVAANGWMEASNVVSIVTGLAIGGLLVGHPAALPAIGAMFVLSTLVSLTIPRSPARDLNALRRPSLLMRRFGQAVRLLWRDVPARLSLAVTSLFWAASAVLQFLVLRWADERLDLPLSRAALLQVVVAVGMVIGAVLAARFISTDRATRALPLGVALGGLVSMMAFVSAIAVAVPLLFVVGVLAGLVLVPMNAVLQARGAQLMDTGQSIAVQNFYESLATLVALGLYALLVWLQLSLWLTLLALGLILMTITLLLLQIEGGGVARNSKT